MQVVVVNTMTYYEYNYNERWAYRVVGVLESRVWFYFLWPCQSWSLIVYVFNIQDCEFSMRVSYLELYNEELFDLLGAAECETKLRIYDDSNKKVRPARIL